MSQDVPQAQRIATSHTIGQQATVLAPIALKANDHIWIDMRTSQVHLVERRGIVV